MAIDTADRRASAIMPGLPFRGLYPLPNGTIAGNDRPQVIFLYRFTAEVVVIIPQAGFVIIGIDRRESLFALAGVDRATEVVGAIDVDRLLSPLAGMDAAETLIAQDRNEALRPLEART